MFCQQGNFSGFLNQWLLSLFHQHRVFCSGCPKWRHSSQVPIVPTTASAMAESRSCSFPEQAGRRHRRSWCYTKQSCPLRTIKFECQLRSLGRDPKDAQQLSLHSVLHENWATLLSLCLHLSFHGTKSQCNACKVVHLSSC